MNDIAHTVEDDYQHFLAYTGFEHSAALRHAYYHGANERTEYLEKSDVLLTSTVQQAVDDEQLTGTCPPELFLIATADMDSFLAYSASLVHSTKTSIAKRLGLEVRCPCGESTCVASMEPGCGMLVALDQAELFATPDDSAVVPWKRDDDTTEAILSLIGGTGHITVDLIKNWSDAECQAAEEYAIAVHTRASDNDGYPVPPKPAVLEVSA